MFWKSITANDLECIRLALPVYFASRGINGPDPEIWCGVQPRKT